MFIICGGALISILVVEDVYLCGGALVSIFVIEDFENVGAGVECYLIYVWLFILNTDGF